MQQHFSMNQRQPMKAHEAAPAIIPATGDAAVILDYFHGKSYYTYQNNRVVFHEMDPITEIYCQLKGTGRITRITNKKEFTVSISGPGQVFGLEIFINRASFSYSLTTIEPAVFCCIRKQDFKKAIRNDTSFALQLMKMMQKEISRLEDRHNQLQNQTVQANIAAIIVENNRAHPNGLGATSGYSMEVSDLADMARISESHLYRVLEEFSKKKYLQVAQKKVVVLNYEGLKTESISGK